LKLALLACFVSSWIATACADAVQFADPREDARDLFSAVQRRLALMPDVARWKYSHVLAIRDPARESVVLDDMQKQAGELGLDGALVREFFRVQIDAASELQEQEIARLNAGRALGDVKDLTRELRPQLDALGKQMLVSLYVVAADLPVQAKNSQFNLAKGFAESGLSPQASQELERLVLQMRFVRSPSLEVIKQVGVLRIATTADYAPFSALDGDALVGSDIDSAEKFARSLGAKPHFVRTSWPTLMSDYRNNEFDLAVGGISVTPERSAIAEFTIPYHHGGKTAIVRCGEQEALDTLEEIDSPSVRIIVNPGGTNEQFVKDHFHRARVTVFADNTKIFKEIADGHADVMVTDDAEVDLQVSRNPSLCRATSKTFTQSDKAWMLIHDAGLLKAANAWLATHGAK
jgi:cyclohexadienyl dehydratase